VKPHHRLFFAVRPPAGAVRYIVEEQRCFGPGHVVRPEHLHLTTLIVEDHAIFPTAVAERMRMIGDRIAAEQFPVVLDQVAGSHRSVAMVPSERLRSFHAFQRRLAGEMARAGLAQRRDWRFSPHVTLLYRHGAPLRQWTDALSWTATEFVLIHSLLGQTRHEVLARWPLLVPRRGTLH
jgi:2'-5' RNA ligase